MPNIVNESLFEQLQRDFREAGSCLVLEFDKLTVQQDGDLRSKLRELGVDYRVVKNRLASLAIKETLNLDMEATFVGKCGVVFAPEEKAISAAKAVREAMKVHKKDIPVRVIGGIIEGEAIVGPLAATIADMPDRQTVNGMLATALIGPARMLATVLQAVPAGLARCIQAKIDKEQDS
jgi:large subunit ribosomal protein L10